MCDKTGYNFQVMCASDARYHRQWHTKSLRILRGSLSIDCVSNAVERLHLMCDKTGYNRYHKVFNTQYR
jgi:hypothetical protein